MDTFPSVRIPCSHPHLIKITFNPLMKHQPVLALLMNVIGKNVAKFTKIKFEFCHANVRKKSCVDNEGISAASFCRQVAALVPDMF
jgi:hypothetical protein